MIYRPLLALFFMLSLFATAQVNWDSVHADRKAREPAVNPEYLSWAKEAHEVLKSHPPFLGGEAQTDGGVALCGITFGLDAMLAYASGTLQLHAVTEEEEFLELGDALFNKLLERLRLRQNDNLRRRATVAGPLGRSAYFLNKLERLDAKERKLVFEQAVLLQRDIAKENDETTELDRLRRMAGGAWLLRLFPDEAGLAQLRAEVTSRFERYLDPNEVPGTGQREQEEALCRLLLAGRALKRSADLRSLEPLFQRSRDLIDPTGYPYRTSGERWAPSVLHAHVMEAATRLFADGSYREAGNRSFALATSFQTSDSDVKGGITGHDAHLFMPLLSMPAVDIAPSLPETANVANKDWLILQTGDARVVLHLSGTPDQRPAIQSYSANGVPLYRGSMFQDAEAANLLLLQDAALSFPFDMVRQSRLIDSGDEKAPVYSFLGAAGPFTNCVVEDVSVEEKNGDVFGRVSFSKYGTDDTLLTRRLTLTAEGILTICDDLTPGADAKGMNAGPTWHVEEDGPKDLDAGWVFQWPLELAPDHPKAGMLVAFAKLEGDEVSTSGASVFDSYYIRKSAQGSMAPGRTVSLARNLKTDSPTRFVTTLVPSPPDAKASTIAKTIESTILPSGAVDISIRRGNETILITFAKDGTPRVLRSPNE